MTRLNPSLLLFLMAPVWAPMVHAQDAVLPRSIGQQSSDLGRIQAKVFRRSDAPSDRPTSYWVILDDGSNSPEPSLPDTSWTGVRVEPSDPKTNSPVTRARLLHGLLTKLRETDRIEGLRFHLVTSPQRASEAWEFLRLFPYELQTLVVPASAVPASAQQLARARRVRVVVLRDTPDPVSEAMAPLRATFPTVDGAEVARWEHLDPAWWQQVSQPTPQDPREAEVHLTLDGFHEAAAQADEARYFQIFAEDGIFLGTDATERWDRAAFEAFAMPYFTTRSSAWIFIPLERHIQVAPDGTWASFDESLGSHSYGECRGTGVLRRADSGWRITQYNLTVPVPNDLLGATARKIAAFESGLPLARTIILVRHAEKGAEPKNDPPLLAIGQVRAQHLAQVLRSAGVGAVFTTNFERTRATAGPLCETLGLSSQVYEPKAYAELLRTIQTGTPSTVVVVGHSNTLTDMIEAWGGGSIDPIDDDEYDRLFVVRWEPHGVSVMTLRYGQKP